MPNVINVHTCAFGGVNLVVAMVLIMDVELLEFACDMVSGTSVHDLAISTVVVVVATIVVVVGGVGISFARNKVLVEVIPAVRGHMARDVTHLAPRAMSSIASIAMATAVVVEVAATIGVVVSAAAVGVVVVEAGIVVADVAVAAPTIVAVATALGAMTSSASKMATTATLGSVDGGLRRT
jgi:hypothetical protein